MSAKPLLVVIGATGVQGRSVVNAVLKSQAYHIRGVTRNPSSAKAAALAAQGVELFQADINDEASLTRAFHGATAIFAATDFFEPFISGGPAHAIKTEFEQGTKLARAASKTPTLRHYLWSTLPNAAAISNGKFHVPHFEGKNQVDAYIRDELPALAAITTFFWVGYYAGNLKFPVYEPTPFRSATLAPDTYLWLQSQPASTPVTTISDAEANVGLFALATLQHPELTLPARHVLAATETLTFGELLDVWAKAAGKKSTAYVQVSFEDYKRLWPGLGEEMGLMNEYWADAKEKSWSVVGGEKVIGWKELGLEREGFVNLLEAFAKLSWD